MMTIPNLPTPLTGIVPPMVTPLHNDDELDHEGIRRNVDHLMEGGVHGIFILGTTGEGPHLSYQLRRQLIDSVCEHAAGRVPILVGISDSSFAESKEMAAAAYAAGAVGVVAAPPFYLELSQPELERYFQHLADGSNLPLFLYNMPSCVKIEITPNTIQLLKRHENIVGIKDSSGNFEYLQRVIEIGSTDEDFSILVGPEALLVKAVPLGIHGGVHGGANLFPQVYVKLYQAILANCQTEIERLNGIVQQIGSLIYGVAREPSRHIRTTKSAMHQLGLCSDYVAWPLRGLDVAQKQRIAEGIQQLSEHPESNVSRLTA